MEIKDLSASLEDYLEAIYQISRQEPVVRVNRIAEYLKVNKSSVTWALNQLTDKDLVTHTPYESITLTEKGEKRGAHLARRHEEIKTFLMEVLGVNETMAEENACRMEHILDKEILHWMRQFVEFLDNCPRAGRQWMKGFGYFCDHGKKRENCERCVSECLEDLARIEDIRSAPSEELPKTTKRRDEITLQRLKEVLAESGRKLTAPQEKVIDLFMQTEKHQPLENIYRQARMCNEDVTRADAEEAMRILCAHKIARELRYREKTVYEHNHPESHHDHIFCVKCGSIVEFFDPRIEELQEENARRADFRLLMHTLNIYGVCRECITKEARTRPLDKCLAGEAVQVAQIVADEQTRRRLADMDLAPGSILEILSEQCPGDNLIVMQGASRLMLDKKTARKISVIPADKERIAVMPQRRRARHRHAADRTIMYPKDA